MEKRRAKERCAHKFRTYRISTDEPIPLDISREITKLFDVKFRRKQRISEYMCDSIRKTKQKASLVSYKELKVISLPAKSREIREYLKKCPSTFMSRFQEKDIKNKINGRGLEEKYPQLLKTIMNETKEEYLRITHYAGMNMKVKESSEESGSFIIKPFKYLGKSENYHNYLAVRDQLANKWILHKPILLKLLKECVTKLPYEIIHMEFTEVFSVNEFKNILNKKIFDGQQFMNDFYAKIENLIDTENVHVKHAEEINYLDACSGLLSVHMSRSVAHTLLHVVNFTTKKGIKPYLKLNITFNGQLEVMPASVQLIEIFRDFCKQIINLASNFKVFQANRFAGALNKHIYLCLTDEFFTSCIDKISENINKQYMPINLYLEELSNNFLCIYPEITSDEYLKSYSDISLDFGCEKIVYYKNYLQKIQLIPDNEYFSDGEINLLNYRETLYKGLKTITNIIFNKLRSQHFWESNDVCESYEHIYLMATKKTITTEELIETGKFMNWVKDEHLHTLNERVVASIESLCKIILLGFLNKDHLKRNSLAVNWMQKITPVLEQHSTVFEQLKFEAEEYLQKVIEDVNVSIKEVYPSLVILDEMDNICNANKYLNDIILYMKKIKNIEEQINWINQEEVCLSFPKSIYGEYEDLKNYVYPFYHLLKICLDVQRNLSVWQDGQFDKLNYDKTNQLVDKYYKELNGIQKDYRKKLRQAQDDNLPVRFKGTVDDPDILNWPAPLKLSAKAIKMIEDFKPSIRVMKTMCNYALTKRHWKAMSEIAGFDITPNAGTTLRKIMKIDLQTNFDKYEIISVAATKEKLLWECLENLKNQWRNVLFKISKHDDVDIVVSMDQILDIIDDHKISITNMKCSVFVEVYEKEVNEFYNTLITMEDILKLLEIVQTNLLKFLPIFYTEKISQILAQENESFKKVEEIFTKYLETIKTKLLVIEILKQENFYNDLNYCINQLEFIKKGVHIYIQKLEDYFPRFYFLSSDELLQILSKSNNPSNIQPHLKKIFQQIFRININADLQIYEMCSENSEIVPFLQPIDVSKPMDNLEIWLSELEQQMIDTLKSNLLECKKYYKKERFEDLIKKWPQQILELMLQIQHTETIEKALSSNNKIRLRLYFKKLENSVNLKITMINNSNLTNVERKKVKNLLITEANNKTITNNLLKNKITSLNDFNWESQLKYYYENEKCYVTILQRRINYLFEYQGNSNQIIITPLTARCFRSLINANCLHLNALIQGTAEVGKTETVKSLSKAFAVLIIIFNCSEYLNYRTIQRFVDGASYCGAWLCIKKINFIQKEILSVVHQNILNISTSLKAGVEGNSIKQSCFICATLDTNYQSKKNFPENFKLLFRTVTITVPDFKVIGEVSLFSIGFVNGKILASQLIIYFKFLKGFLNTTFGLERIKIIIKECEKYKRINPKADEFVILSKALQKTVHPSLPQSNLNIANNILTNIFGNKEIKLDNLELIKEIKNYFTNYKLIENDDLINKTLNIYESVNNYNGLIVLGPAFTGKTTLLKMCAELFSKNNNCSISKHIINPKCFEYEQLYEKFDSNVNEWTDGIVTKALRKSSKGEPLWLIFDASIDSSWIENINSVLEKEQRYYLSSGEAVILEETHTIIFEVTDLVHASPSTISHCGLVYVEPTLVTWKSVVESWFLHSNSEWIRGYNDYMIELFKWIVPASLAFIRKHCLQFCAPGEINLVKNMLRLSEMLLDDACANEEDQIKYILSWIQATLLQSGVWGLAGTLDINSRQKFDEFYKQLWKGLIVASPYPQCLEKLDVTIPQEGILFDYSFIYKQRGNWKLWSDLLKTRKVVECEYMLDYLVPTIETLRYSSVLNLHMKYKNPVILIGPPATGKTLLMEDLLINQTDENLCEIIRVCLNVNLTPKHVQSAIVSKLDKRKFGVYAPYKDKNCIVFIEDLNTTKKDNFGVTSVTELLRQYLDYSIWYDYDTFKPITLKDANFIGTMCSSGGYRQTLSERFLRHFYIYSINEFADDTITKIYSTVLQHTWKKSGFPSDIINMTLQITQSTLYILNEINKHFKQTLNQIHYCFNLRDFSRIIKSCLMLKKETYDGNKKIYLKLWTHEILRNIGDKLNKAEDNIWLYNNIKTAFAEIYKEDFNESFESDDSLNHLLFAYSFDNESQNNKYEEVVNINNFKEIIITYLNDFNAKNDIKLDIAIFEESVMKLSKLLRILKCKPGNALLIGTSGSGRQTLSKLASFMCDMGIFQPNISVEYNIECWNCDIKYVLRESGGCGNEILFLICEEQILHDLFLENINFLLKGSEIPTLYDMNEKQNILQLVRLSAQGGNKNVDISSSAIFLYFHKRCLENLHIILCLNSLGNTLHRRISKYSYLLNCNVIWWNDWPDTYFENMSETFIKNLDLADEVKFNITKACVFIHRDIQKLTNNNLKYDRRIFISTTNFAHFIKLFVELVLKKQESLTTKKNKYLQGLNKLSFAAKQILDMQNSLADYQPQLEEMTQKAIEMTKQIALETIEVEKASALVRTDEKVAHEQAEVAQVLKSECEAELAQAIPILEDAISALNTLKPSDITLVKSMKNPPDAIKLVMAAVCVIKDVRPDRIPDPSTGRKTLDYWGPSKRILGDMNFLQTLKDFDKDNIKPEIMVKIRKDYLPHKDFKPHVVAKASSAAEGLCKWIIAMDMYDKVAKEVAPKKEKLEKAEKEYATTMAILNEKKDEVTRIEEKLASLKELLEEAREKQVKLQKEVDICKEKLRKAQKLIGGLSDEKIKWTEISENLQINFNCLSGDILLSSAIIAYLSGFLKCERIEIMAKWQECIKNLSIPGTEYFQFTKIVGSDNKIEKWLSLGLPNDINFVENGIISECTKLFTLFIDPQNTACNWLQIKENRNDLVIAKFSDNNYFSKIIDCIQFGKPILIQHIGENIPKCLLSLFKKESFCKNDIKFINVNGKNIKLLDSFKLYMISNKPNPNYKSYIWSKLTIINFFITTTALTDYLLTVVVEIEKPEFKKMKKQINSESRKNKLEIKQLENKILFTLTESDTDILEDENSIKILDESKELAKHIRLKQHNLIGLEKTLTSFKTEYLKFAEHACILYFCIYDMHHVHYIYQFSLEWFINVYFNSILNAMPSKTIEKRRKNLITAFTYDLYTAALHSLYNKDKILLAFLISCRILISRGEITKHEYMFFICGKCDMSLQEENPLPKKIPDNIWNNVCHLNILPIFKDFKELFRINFMYWNKFLTCDDPFLCILPDEWRKKLNAFHKIILINLLRPDKLYDSVLKFIENELGYRYVSSSPLNFIEVYNKTFSLQPVIFVLTPGDNPLNMLNHLVKLKKFSNKFHTLSIGEDDCEKTHTLIKHGREQGSWIFLENIQCGKAWLNSIETKIEEMDYTNTHENFRFWISVEPYPEFSQTLLQKCIKLINEPEEGLKNKLLNLYKNEPIIDESFYRGCPGKHEVFAKLLYGLAFFHASIQERQNICSLDVPYLFSDQDFYISVEQLQKIVNQKNFSFNKLNYIIGKCNYGGYIGNDYGILLLKTLLKHCLNDDVVNTSGFCFNDIKTYGLPNKSDHQDYINYINKLPSYEETEVFGLHSNNNIHKGFQYKHQFFRSIRLVGSSGYNFYDLHENETLLLCKINDIIHNLPEELSLDKFQAGNFTEIIVHKEIQEFNKLLLLIKQDLSDYKNILQGDKPSTFVTNNLETSMEGILKNKTPFHWLNSSSENLTFFLKKIVNKHLFLKYYINNNGIIEEFDFSLFENPKSLIYATKIDFSKKYNIPLTDIIFNYKLLNNKSACDCLKIANLHLINASWNLELNILEESLPKLLYDIMPPITFTPINNKEKIDYTNYLKCQIYKQYTGKVSIFENYLNYIKSIRLNSNQNPNHWIKRGVAIFSEISFNNSYENLIKL